jgi:hypothetical protein
VAFQFPANPAMGQTFNPVPGVLYRWNGVGWVPFSTIFYGSQAFANPVLFADGTVNAPGIAWSGDTDTGFMRIATGMQAVVDSGIVLVMAGTAVTANVALNANAAMNVGGALWTGSTLSANHITSRTDLVANSNSSTAGTHYTGALSVSGGAGFTDGLETYGSFGGVSYANVNNCTNNSHRVAFGWRSDGTIGVRVGGSQFNSTWPINITGNAGYAGSAGSASSASTASNANAVNGISGWNWSNPHNAPLYLWGNDGGSNNQFLIHRASMSVNYANDSGAVNGISGWAYRNDANNPAYLWCTEGSGGAQHLTQPGNINVNYANSCNSANYATTAGNANAVGGVGSGNNTTTNDGSVTNIKVYFNGEKWVLQVSGSQGTHEFSNYTGSGGTDGIRAKDNIAYSSVDATSALDTMQMIQFNDKLAGGQHVPLGFLPANLESINPQLVFHSVFPGDDPDAPRDTLNVDPIGVLAYVVKALQETTARLTALEAR